MFTTNYRNTLITPASDGPDTSAPPVKAGTIAALQFAALASGARMTSDELLLQVEQQRKGDLDIPAFLDKPKACLRASPLAKTHGYAFYHDQDGVVELVPVPSGRYFALLDDPDIAKTPAMRKTRA